MTDHGVAETIVRQLGGANRLSAMLGRGLILIDLGDGVSLRWGKHFATVKINPLDYYDVTIGRIGSSRSGYAVHERTFTDVDAAALKELIELETGYRLSL